MSPSPVCTEYMIVGPSAPLQVALEIVKVDSASICEPLDTSAWVYMLIESELVRVSLLRFL